MTHYEHSIETMTIPDPLQDFLDREQKYIEASKSLANAKKAHARRHNPSFKLCLFRDHADLLLDKTDFCFRRPELSSTLKGWIGRSRSNEQLRIKGYAEKAAIVASASWEKAMSFVHCSPKCNRKKKQFPCGMTDYCPACHWARIGDAIFREYMGAFGKAGPWYAITVSFVWHHGRLKLVTRKGRKCQEKESLRHEAFLGAPRLQPLVFSESDQIQKCGGVAFDLLRVLGNTSRGLKLLNGALAALDCHVSFFPAKAPKGDLSVGDGLIVHTHVLANTGASLDWDTCQEIYRALLDHCQEAAIRLQPDLHISPLQSKGEFLAWLKYVVKPLVFEKFYAEGAFACSDRPEHFNLHFDQVVFSGLANAYAGITSPRRFGNMRYRPGQDGYIGDYQYKKRIGDKTFRALRLREREPALGPLTAKEKKQLDYERKRRAQRRRQVREWQEDKKTNRRQGRSQR
ncbi:MAG TPA: hypothetical protein VG167_07360 [Verrucomicrobiae bacterium]|nr:hypothetical protein [Verrucomicrobiae bacterium]